MGTVRQLAIEIEAGLRAAHPTLRKTVITKLEDTPLRAADRLDRLLLIMALAMYWCVRVGQEEARDHPTPLEKKRKNKPTPTIGA